MLTSLITNNCWGGVISHNYGMALCSPTVNLQILPEEFPDFCDNLKFYMKQDLIECTELTPWHRDYMTNMFGDSFPDCPLGMIVDILVVFQHYTSFSDAKRQWEKRKARIDYDNIGYFFHVNSPKYSRYARDFIRQELPNSVCVTEGFTLDGAYRFDVPEGKDAFGAVDDRSRRLIEQEFKIKDWLEGKL